MLCNKEDKKILALFAHMYLYFICGFNFLRHIWAQNTTLAKPPVNMKKIIELWTLDPALLYKSMQKILQLKIT